MFLILQETVGLGLLFRLLMLVMAYLIVKFTRTKLLKKLNELMMTTSAKAEETPREEIVLKHRTAQNPLQLRELTSDSELPDAQKIREGAVKNASAGFKKLFFTDVFVAILYGLLPLLWSYTENYVGASMYFFYVVVVLIWIVMRFIGHQNQFKAYRSGIFGFLSPLTKKLFFPFQPLWCQVLFIFLMILGIKNVILNFAVGAISTGVVFLIPILVHLYFMRQLRVRGRERNNIKLLILRVFFIDESSAFTFSNLAKYWKHFGSYFTVADPSFYRVFWKRKYKNNFPIFIIVVFLLFTQLTDDQPMGAVIGMFVFFTLLLIIGAFIYVSRSTRKMANKFVHSETQLKQRLTELDKWPVNYDNSFKEFPVMCYDNTWKIGVNTLVQEASVIMMDLRGFSEKNKGCEFEIDFILDHVLVHQILFVCKPEALALVRRTITERWKSLAESSPNHKLKAPQANLFIAEKENTKELQSIMDLLLKAAQAS
jgi:hypothetical protein